MMTRRMIRSVLFLLTLAAVLGSSAAVTDSTTPMLVVLLEFADSDMSTILPDPETAWANLMFGSDQGEGNHYWNEVSGGQFQLEEAVETDGNPDNGVIRVWISDPRPTGPQKYRIEDQTWIPEALDLASAYVRFDDYDTNSDGIIENQELSILFVLNIDYLNVDGAGAEANIRIDHPVNGTGPTIEKFARTLFNYTSIGVNVHELGHHIFGLQHFVPPTEHGLMGTGAYGEDPVITRLHDDTNHSGTRPTHPIGFNKARAGFFTPTEIRDTTLNVTLNSPHTNDYNVIKVPVVGGFLYLENRTKEGYDQSIPFCGAHEGALFVTDVAQYVEPLHIPSIDMRRDTFEYDWPLADDLCSTYALSGHGGSFDYGGYTITNVSAAGPTMTFDLIRENVTPTIQNYKYRYLIDDPARPGDRLQHFLTAEEGVTSSIDMSTFVDGRDASRTFPISLWSFYNTGEVRSVNLETTWTTPSDYLRIEKFPTSGGGVGGADALVSLSFDPDAAYQSSAIVDVEHDGFQSSFELFNLPCHGGAGCLSYDGVADLSEVAGNGNGGIDPGETWELIVNLRNETQAPAVGVSADLALDPASPVSVTLLQAVSTYGDIAVGEVASSHLAYRFRVDSLAPCGASISLGLAARSTDPANAYPTEVGVLRLPVGGTGPVTVFYDDFESLRGWGALQPGEWQIDIPRGLGGPIPDPNDGYDGPHVLGTDLTGLGLESGNYETSSTSFYLSPALDVSRFGQLSVSYARRLNVGAGDRASFKIWTSDAAQWLTLFSSDDATDSSWTVDTPIDIADIADGRSQIRFGFWIESDAQETASGWNVDAFEVRGVPSDSCEPYDTPLPGEALNLRVDKGAPGELLLTWGADCGNGEGYSVYSGDLELGYGSLAPEPGLCDVAATSALVPEGPRDAEFFLVVPYGGGHEGSYGVDSGGVRAPMAGACRPQGEVAVCDASSEWDAVDQTLFETLQWIADQEQGYSLWNEAANAREFVVSETPAYFVRRDEHGGLVKAYLVNFPNPPAGAVEIDHAFSGIGTVHRYDAEMDELSPAADFEYALDLSGRPTYAMGYTASNMDQEPSGPDYTNHDVWVDMFVHELFHYYQFWGPDSVWIRNDWGGLPPSDYPVTTDNIALSILERRALLAGRDAATVPEKVEALRRVLAIRHARTQLPEAVRERCQVTASASTHGLGATAPQGLGQSFTACISGAIRSVRVDVLFLDHPDARIELQTGSSSWPGSYSQNVVLVPGENVIQLDVPFEVASGAEYSLGIFPSTGALSLSSAGDSYAGGRAFFVSGSSSTEILPSPDLVFGVTIGNGANHVDRMDREQERVEGSAMQVALRLFVNSGTTAYADELLAWLERSTWTHYQTSRDQLYATLFQGGWYSTGSTLLDLVDEVTSLDWRSSFPAGGTPIGLLETLYGPLAQQEVDQLVAEARQAYDWQAIVDQVAAIPPEYLDPALP